MNDVGWIPATPTFRVTHRLSGRAAFVDIEGELDLGTAPRVCEVLALILEGPIKPGRLVIDMSQVSFIDSTGYLTVEAAVVDSGWKGELELEDPSLSVRRILELLWELPISSDQAR